MSKKKVLVTGGFGFVGSQLLNYISQRFDLDITVIDNLLSGDILYYDDIKFIYSDIRHFADMAEIIPNYDTIVHLAAIVGEPACVVDRRFSYDVNVNGTRVLLESMTNNQHIIFTSTSSIYGNRPNELVTEDSELKPVNNYATQKYTSELDIRLSGYTYTILRPVTAFGVTNRTRLDLLVNTLIYEAITTGKIEVFESAVMRPIIHVNDFARILEWAIDNRFPRDTVYNIGDNRYSMTKLDLARTIADLCGAIVVEKEGVSLDPRNYDVSFDKLMSTGFMFGYNRLEQAIEQIQAVQKEISVDISKYSTPHKVKEFLTREYK